MAVLNEEQTMLRDMAREWVQNEQPITAFRRLRDSGRPEGYDPQAWSTMAEMGWTGVIVPEAHGGSEFGYLSLGLVFEELGRNLVASPLGATSAAAGALVLAGSGAQQAEWLPRIAGGELVATLAIDEGPHHDPDTVATTARRDGDGWVLNGTKAFVPEGDTAGLFIVSAKTDAGRALFLVPGDAAGVTRATRKMADARSHAEVRFADVRLPAAALLGAEDGGQLIDQVLDRARVITAAEMLGMATQAFETTVDYLKVRVQFGQPIGAFQALQHRAAHLLTQIELMRSAVEAALEAIDAKRSDLPEAASLAKAIANETLHLVSREMVQLHGGIGMTDEHDAGFYLKRSRVLENQWGSAAFHRDRFAKLNGF